jgi:hypothetical protein
VPRAAPAIVLAVPGVDNPGSAEIANGVAGVVAQLCPGVEIRTGYTQGGPLGLGSLLPAIVAERATGQAGELDLDCPYAAVVVPLAITPDPDREAAIDQVVGQIVAQVGPAVIRTPQLGPHPVLAGALHDRLAEAGLVQGRRISGLSLVRLDTGVLIGAVGGEQARLNAETAALMLTARLGVPVAASSLGHRESLEDGVTRLREAGARHLALAPYVVGPEISPANLAAAATAAGAQCGPPLGAHVAVGQLVTMRYGQALLGQRLPATRGMAPLGPARPPRQVV